MSATPPALEWFIARDGVQHGPISDVEMMKFVELGHLKPTDLVWCARFSDWQPGAVVFPVQTAPKPPQPPAPRPQPAAAPPQAAAVAPAAVQQTFAAAPASPQQHPQPLAQGQPQAHPQAFNQPLQHPQGLPHTQAAITAEERAWADAMRAVVQGAPAVAGQPHQLPRQMPSPGHAPEPALLNQHFGAAGGSGNVSFEPMSQAYQPDAALDDFDRDEPEQDELPRGRGWVRQATMAVAVLLILGGLGWLGWQNRNLVTGAAAIPGMLTQSMSGAPPAAALRASPFEAAGETRDLIDVSLQKSGLWRVLKRDFADWYAERLADVERMRAQKGDEKVISKFLADVVVTLRRRNSVAALQSSPDHLKRMATAFIGNLKQLASRDGQTCHGFITFGEAHPFMIELARTPAFAEALQGQLIAVFEAIAHGRANRLVHPATRRSDYEALTKELTGRGWSQADLATFSDPQKLSASAPDKVCTLVQEWFTTQLSLRDQELQTRLLAESLKPLVGG